MEMLAAEICAFGLGLAFLLGKRKKYGYKRDYTSR